MWRQRRCLRGSGERKGSENYISIRLDKESPSELIPVLVKVSQSFLSNPEPYLIPYITCELEVDSPKDPTISVLICRSGQIRDASRDHTYIIDRHIAAQRHIDAISAVPGLDDGGCRTTESSMSGEVILVIWGWGQQGSPVRVRNVASASEVDLWIANCGYGAPAVVEIPGVMMLVCGYYFMGWDQSGGTYLESQLAIAPFARA